LAIVLIDVPVVSMSRVIQLLAREGRLPAAVSVITGLGVLDTGALRFFGRLGLRLREGRHERDQRIADRHLHRVFGCAVEDKAVEATRQSTAEHLLSYIPQIDDGTYGNSARSKRSSASHSGCAESAGGTAPLSRQIGWICKRIIAGWLLSAAYPAGFFKAASAAAACAISLASPSPVSRRASRSFRTNS
jgi:hypothetical protein